MNISSIFPPMITLFRKFIARPVYGILYIVTLGSLISLFFHSCSKEVKPKGLAADPDIKAIFTEEEIKDLTIILDFFEQQICDLNQVSTDSVLNCYAALFKTMSRAELTGFLYVPVPFHLQKEMYTRLSDAAFTEIWTTGIAVNQITGDTTQRLMLSFDGKFMNFLNAIVRDYQVLTAYRNSFSISRKVTPIMIDAVMHNHYLLDLNDIRIRLFVALHYLTINDVYERKNE